jgi:hypothetical protein
LKEYNTKFLSSVYSEEGRGVFTVRHNVLGHMQVIAIIYLDQGILKGEYPCTVDLLFDWLGLVCFANENRNCQLSYMSNKSNRRSMLQ